MAAGGIRPTCGNADQREIGTGAINFAPMFAAAKNRSKYYFMERDPVGIGGATNFNPFTNADNSLKAMRADAAGHAVRRPADVHVGRGRHGRGGQPGAGHRHQRRRRAADDHRRHGRGRRARRRRRDRGGLLDRQPELLRHRLDAARAAHARRSPDDPSTPRRRVRRAQAGRHVHGQRRLQADAHELHVGRAPAVHVHRRRRDGPRPARRQEHAATRSARVGGDVPSMLALDAPGARAVSFGTFVPDRRAHLRHGAGGDGHHAPPATRRCRSSTRTRSTRASSTNTAGDDDVRAAERAAGPRRQRRADQPGVRRGLRHAADTLLS